MFSDDGVGPAIDDRMHYGIPDTPKILSSGFAIRDPVYNLTWEKPWAPSDDPVLYYALRYRMVGEPKWKNVNEILASATQVVYSYEFHYLEWNVADHEFEVYAGSSEGVSRPAVGIIPKGK